MERVSAATPSTAAAKLAALRAAKRRAHGTSETVDRDPRAAPESLRKNVTIAESCEFYGIQDAVSTCRVPRSCQDCVTMPDCVITPTGQCKSIPDMHVDQVNNYDYHQQLAAYPQGTGYNISLSTSTPISYFYAANTTYCAASDAVCAQCRATFRDALLLPKADYYVGSQFCVGVDGCVCVAICEVPELRDKKVYDRDCGQSAPKGIKAKPTELQAFTTTHRDPRGPLVNVHKRVDKRNSCAYRPEQDVRGCHQPRTCQECLQQDDCVISRFKCAPMDDYQPYSDFRLAKLDENNGSRMSYAQFPSTNTTYCPSTDPVCSACRRDFQQSWKKNSQWEIIASTSEFCVGVDGCVCIEACESIQWSSGVRDTECSTLTGKVPNSPTVPLIITAVIGLLLLALYKGSTQRIVPPTGQAVEEMFRHMLDEAPAIGRLDLFGWRAFHERLLAKEEELLRGEEPGSPVVAPVSFDFEASAPDFDEDESSAPTVQNPTALASAPAFGHVVHEADESTSRDQAAPSAPSFDDEDSNWLPASMNDENEGRGTVTRRRSRHSMLQEL